MRYETLYLMPLVSSIPSCYIHLSWSTAVTSGTRPFCVLCMLFFIEVVFCIVCLTVL